MRPWTTTVSRHQLDLALLVLSMFVVERRSTEMARRPVRTDRPAGQAPSRPTPVRPPRSC